jgi:hypothetical protein
MKLLRIFVLIMAILPVMMLATTVYAIDEPDSTPVIMEKYCYRNILETGDFFLMIYENTPYATTPDTDYSEAFVWRFMDTDGTSELAQALGYDYNDNGYGYNVIAFYFDADSAPTWGQNYFITLSGTPSAFTEPPQYTYSIEASDYSSLTDSDAVKAAIASQIIYFANDLDNKWGLSTDYSLLLEIETGTVLSICGEAFFRGAIYGVQALAPIAFRLIINNTVPDDREWDTSYVTKLKSQHSGTYIEPAMEAGEDFLDVDYNLMGIIGILAVCVLLIIANWYIGGGNIWRGAIESASPLVIASRMGIFGLGELGLVAALCWLYVSAKVWKMI